MIEQIHTVVSCVKQEIVSEAEAQETAGKRKCNKGKYTPVCYRVRFNTDLEVCFSADEVYEYHFYEEAELRKPFDEIMIRILFRRLLASVLPFVVFTKRTEYQIKTRAEQVSCGEELIWSHYKDDSLEMLLDYLRKEQYVDDARYAEVYVRNQMEKSVSKRAMLLELTKRGISREIAEQAISRAAPDERENAKALLFKKLNSMRIQGKLSQKDKGKLYRFLASKGYNGETICHVMADCLPDECGGDFDANI